MSVLSCAFVAARQIFCELMIISHCVRYFTGGDFFFICVDFYECAVVHHTGRVHQFRGALFLLGVE